MARKNGDPCGRHFWFLVVLSSSSNARLKISALIESLLLVGARLGALSRSR